LTSHAILGSRNKRGYGAGSFFRAFTLLVISCLHGCSVYRLDPGSEPRVLGLGSVEEQPAREGRLFKISMPGGSLRTGYLSKGLTLGWHESLLFCVDREGGGVDCIADQGTSIGLDFIGAGFTLGYYRVLRIPLPVPEASTMQVIHYSQARPGETQVKLRKIR